MNYKFLILKLMMISLLYAGNCLAQTKDQSACIVPLGSDFGKLDELGKNSCNIVDSDPANSCAYNNSQQKGGTDNSLNEKANKVAEQMKITGPKKVAMVAAIKAKLKSYSDSHCGGKPAQGILAEPRFPYVPACQVSNTGDDRKKVFDWSVNRYKSALSGCASQWKNRPNYPLNWSGCDQAASEATTRFGVKVEQADSGKYTANFPATVAMPEDYLRFNKYGYPIAKYGMNDMADFLNEDCGSCDSSGHNCKTPTEKVEAAKVKLKEKMKGYNDSFIGNLSNDSTFADPPVYCPEDSPINDWSDHNLDNAVSDPPPCDVPIDQAFSNNDFESTSSPESLLKDSKAADAAECLENAKKNGLKISNINIIASASTLNNTGNAKKECCGKGFKCLATKRAKTAYEKIVPEVLSSQGITGFESALSNASCDVEGSNGDGTSGPCAYSGSMSGGKFYEKPNPEFPNPAKNPVFDGARRAHALIGFERLFYPMKKIQRKVRTTCYKLTLSCFPQKTDQKGLTGVAINGATSGVSAIKPPVSCKTLFANDVSQTLKSPESDQTSTQTSTNKTTTSVIPSGSKGDKENVDCIDVSSDANKSQFANTNGQNKGKTTSVKMNK